MLCNYRNGKLTRDWSDLRPAQRKGPGGSKDVAVDLPKLHEHYIRHQFFVEHHPELNILINNAGIMKVDNVQTAVDDALVS